MSKVYVLGSINMDMVISSPYIPKEGETIHGSNFFLNCGGKGANQAVAVAKQNVETYLVGNVGDDIFALEMIESLNKYNVDTKYVKRLAGINSGVAVIVISNNDNRIILDAGANNKICLSDIDEFLNDVNEDDIFITQLENNIDAVLYGIKKAKEKKMITIFNPTPFKFIDKEMYKYIDFLIVNEIEFKMLSNVDYFNKEEVLKVINEFNINNLIITLGKEGSLFINKDLYYKIESNKVEVVDTTAAGDTFVGVFASELAKKKDIVSSLNYSSIAASLTCTKEGAQKSIPTLNEINSYLNNLK